MVQNPQAQLDGGVLAFNLTQAGSENKAQPGQEVSIAYRLMRHCDLQTVIASSTADQPYRFILGANSVIKGFEIAVSFLSIGAKGTFLIPSDQAYGKVGQPPDILDDEDLLIEIEVLSAKATDSQSVAIMNDETRMLKAEETKERANQCFREKRYDEALLLFKEASTYISKLSQYTSETQELRRLIL